MDNHEEMCQIVRDYFSGVFQGGHRVDNMHHVDGSSVRVSEEQNRRLIEEVSFDEFTLAIKQMHPDKASGPDGLNPAFFHQFWNMLGKEVFRCCKEWL